MLDADDLAELRVLQAKAYGREGGLSEADAARLNALEARRLTAVVPALADADVADVDEVIEIPDWPIEAREDPAFAGLIGGGAESDAAASDSPDGPAPQHWPWLRPLIAAAAALALGIGLGWVLFGLGGDGAIVLTAEQEQRRTELYENSVFDAGSVRVIALADDALVWTATDGEGTRVCVILDVGELSSQDCRPVEEVKKSGIGVGGLSTHGGDDELETSINAYMLYSVSGEPMVSIQRWSNSSDSNWLEQFDEAERPRAEALVAEGFEAGSVSLVGSLRAQPVWAADRSGDRCLILDAAPDVQAVCAPLQDVFDSGLSVGAVSVDGKGAKASEWQVELNYTRWQNPYLTISGGENALQTIESGDEIPIENPGG